MRHFTVKITKDKRFWAVLYTLMALLAVVSVYEGIKNGIVWSQDFQYDAATALTRGYDPYDLSVGFDEKALPDIEYLKGFYGYYEGLGTPQRMEANQFPSLLYILTPFTLMPYGAARILWVITNLVATSVIIWLLKKTFMAGVNDRLYPVFVLLMLMGTPWRNQIGVGQHTLFAFAFFLAAVWLACRAESAAVGIAVGLADGVAESVAKGLDGAGVDDHDAKKSAAGSKALPYTIASGLLLSLCYLKYTVTAPLAIWFIYRKRYKEFAISLVPHVILTGVAAAVLKSSYIDMLVKPLKVASALAGEGSIDIGAIFGGAGIGYVFTIIIMIFILALAIALPEGNDELFISLAALLSLVMTYHRTYDFFIMIIVFGYFATGRMKAAEVIYFITTLAFFFALRVFHENVISLTVAGALYYACAISFAVVAVEKCIKRTRA